MVDSHHSIGDVAQIEILNAYIFPISLEIMTNPLFADDSHIYEHAMIHEWFDRGEKIIPKKH